MKPEKHSDLQTTKIDNNFSKLYLIHHMHHFETDEGVRHELHHCLLYSDKDMRGNKYQISHFVKNKELYHCVDKNYSGILFDHDNNEFDVINGIISI